MTRPLARRPRKETKENTNQQQQKFKSEKGGYHYIDLTLKG